MKMKANQLMIGDIVKTYHGYEIVANVYANSIFTEDGIWEGEEFEEGEFKPVPLTTKILELNGFYLHNFGINTEMYYYAFPKECGIPVERGFGIHEQNRVFFITDHCLMPIRYVHELQKALRCCELWDLANNFKIKQKLLKYNKT